MNYIQRNTNGDYYYAVFNIKMYNLDFSLDNLIKYFQTTHKLTKELPNDIDIPDHIYDIAIENAMNLFNPIFNPSLFLVDNQPVDAEFNQVGRSGGWLAIVQFEGYDLINNQPDFDTITQSKFDTFTENVYKLTKNRKKIIEYLAATALFIPQYQNYWTTI